MISKNVFFLLIALAPISELYAGIKKDLVGDIQKKQFSYKNTSNRGINAKIKLGKTVKNIKHDSNETTKLNLRLNMSTTIILPKWERIDNYVLGDAMYFEVKKDKQKRRLILFPEAKDIDTNLTILTKTRTYSFYLKTHGYKTKVTPDLVVNILSEEPEELANSQSPQLEGEYLLEDIINGKKINSMYSIKGDKTLKPTTVFDDGKWTYLYFSGGMTGKRLSIPYAVNGGYNSQVNYRKVSKQNLMIIESVNQEGFTLKNSDKHVCIKPKYDLTKRVATK